MTDEERQLPPDSGHLDPATASGWLETSADPVGRGGWQSGDEQGKDRPRRSASAEAAAIRLFDLEQ